MKKTLLLFAFFAGHANGRPTVAQYALSDAKSKAHIKCKCADGDGPLSEIIIIKHADMKTADVDAAGDCKNEDVPIYSDAAECEDENKNAICVYEGTIEFQTKDRGEKKFNAKKSCRIDADFVEEKEPEKAKVQIQPVQVQPMRAQGMPTIIIANGLNQYQNHGQMRAHSSADEMLQDEQHKWARRWPFKGDTVLQCKSDDTPLMTIARYVGDEKGGYQLIRMVAVPAGSQWARLHDVSFSKETCDASKESGAHTFCVYSKKLHISSGDTTAEFAYSDCEPVEVQEYDGHDESGDSDSNDSSNNDCGEGEGEGC